MYITLFIKLACSIAEAMAILLLSFSLFRVPLSYAWKKMILISFILSTISIYQREFLDQDNYALLTSIIAYALIIRFSFITSTWYSFLLCITGYLSYGILQTILVLPVIALDWTTPNLIETNLLHGSLLQLSTVVFSILIVLSLQKYKVGFMFMIKRHSLKEAVSGYNFYISGIIIMSIAGMQLSFLSFRDNAPMIYFFITMIIIFAIALWTTYKKNKKEILEKYERLRNHDQFHS